MQITVDRLLKDELIFELHCRGASPSDSATVKELQGMLRQLLDLEKLGKSFKSEYNYIPAEELEVINQKLTTVTSILQEPFSSSLARKIETRLTHIFNRLEHIETSDQAESQQKSKLLSVALNYASEYDRKAQEFKKGISDPFDIALQDTSTSTPIKTPDNLTSTDSDNLALKVLQQLTLNESSKIKSWGLTFNGEIDNLSLNSFLERVNELAESRGISKEQLFKKSIELFDGKALIWYRSIKDKVSDWDNLCKYLRKEFLPHNYQDKLWEKIKSRTQGEKESIGIYMAVMNNLFNRFERHVNEEAKLQILRKNILPYYQNHLILRDIDTIDELEVLCKKLEQGKEILSKFLPPTYDKTTVEPDLSYKTDFRKTLNNIDLQEPRVTFKEKSHHKSRDSSRDSCSSNRDSRNKVSANNIELKRVHTYSGGAQGTNNKQKNYGHNSRSRELSRDRSTNFKKQNHNFKYDRDYSRERFRDDSGNKYCTGRSTSNNRSSQNKFDSGNEHRENRSRDWGKNSRHSNLVNSKESYAELICYKCKSKNHLARHCTARICFSCGKVGYTKLNCPRCNVGNSRGNLS